MRLQRLPRTFLPDWTALKRLVASAVVFALLASSPGSRPLWAAVVSQGIGGAEPFSVPIAPIALREVPGGSSFAVNIPAGGLLAPAGSVVGGSLIPSGNPRTFPASQPLSSGLLPSARPARRPAPAGELPSAAAIGSDRPDPVHGLPSQGSFQEALESLSAERLEKAAGEDASAGAESLQLLIQGEAPSRNRQSSEFPVFAGERNAPSAAEQPAGTVRSSYGVKTGLAPIHNGVVPRLGAKDRPESLRAILAEARIWVRSFKYYFVELTLENWGKYKKARSHAAEQVGEGTLAVSAPRALFGDLRLLGMIGGFKTIGSINGNDAYVIREAWKLFNRHFDGPRMPREAREAFTNFLLRAAHFNPGRRGSNLAKHIRRSFLAASILRPQDLKVFFDSRFPEADHKGIEAYQKEGQSKTLAAFREAVLGALQEEAAEADPRKRAVAVVVLGSYASGAATATSDFDIQIVTADGSSGRLEPFMKKLSARWTDPDHPMNAAPFAMTPLRGLLLRVHREPYFVISNDKTLERNLSPPEGALKPYVQPGNPTLVERVQWQAYRAFLSLTLLASDLKDRIGTKAPRIQLKADDPSQPPALDQKARTKALIGLMVSRTLSISAFILSSVAYWGLATSVVGKEGYSNLMSLGSVAAIGLGAFSGVLADRLSIRNSIVLNTAVRAACGLAIFGLAHFGLLSFWPMLLLSLVNGWNMSSVMIAEDRLMPEIAGNDAKKLSGLNALTNVNYFALNVLMGIFLGTGKIVDLLVAHFGGIEGLAVTFLISAVVNFPLVFLVQWFTMPNVKHAKPKPGSGKPAASSSTASLGSWIKPAALWGGILALGGAAHLALKHFLGIDTMLPVVLAMLGGVATTGGFKTLMRNKVLRIGALLGMLSAFLFYPVQQFLIPLGADDLGGGGHLKGQLLGALFFGQFLASSVMLNLPGRWNRVVQGGVLTAMAAWIFFYLFPYNWAALAIGMGLAAILFTCVSSLTDRGWLQFFGLGLSFIWLPFALWNPTYLLISVLMIGLFNGPIQVTLNRVMQKEARESDPQNLGLIMGVRGSLTSAAISLGYGSMGLLTGAGGSSSHMFPSALLPMGIAFTLGAAVFWLLPRLFGGKIAEKLFQMPEWLRRWFPWEAGKGLPVPPSLVFRRAFAALAAGLFGAWISTPKLQASEALALIESRVRQGVKVIVLDYDDTLMDKTPDGRSQPASVDVLNLLRELKTRTGVQIVLSTNHYFDDEKKSLTGLLTDRLDPAVRAGMIVVAQSGARLYEFGPEGSRPSTHGWAAATFDDAERAKIVPVFEAAVREAGLSPGDWRFVHEDDRSLIEFVGGQDRLKDVERSLVLASKTAGWGYRVAVKEMPTARGVPYIQFSKTHKGEGLRQAFERLKARGLVGREEEVLILGDDFRPEGNDTFMAKALPGATALSVGTVTDPTQPNLFRWTSEGAAATRDILRSFIASVDGKKPA